MISTTARLAQHIPRIAERFVGVRSMTVLVLDQLMEDAMDGMTRTDLQGVGLPGFVAWSHHSASSAIKMDGVVTIGVSDTGTGILKDVAAVWPEQRQWICGIVHCGLRGQTG